MINFTSPTKTASQTLNTNGLYVGIVTASNDDGVFVEIPHVSPGFSFGPCLTIGNTQAVSTTGTTAIATSGNDTVLTGVEVTPTKPSTGSKVICGFLNNTLDEVVILGSVL